MTTDRAGLYVHVPFCARKCPYCAFASGVNRDLLPAYVDAVEAEIDARAEPDLACDTVYFGGGTPSLLAPAQARRVLDALARAFAIDDGTGALQLVFFNQPYLEKYFRKGSTVIASGQVKLYRDNRQMAAPEWEITGGGHATDGRRSDNAEAGGCQEAASGNFEVVRFLLLAHGSSRLVSRLSHDSRYAFLPVIAVYFRVRR